MRSNTIEECLLIAQSVFEQLSGDFPPHLIEFWTDSIAYIAKTRSTYNTTEPWQSSVYGNRYGVKASIPGILGEYIAIAALLEDESASDFVMTADKHQQLDLMIDFIDTATDTTYQVKTIRTMNGMVDVDWNISAPDCLVLVDIDDNAIYVVPTASYAVAIEEHPDTRPYGRDGVRMGWTCNVELLRELNLLASHDTKSLYSKPLVSGDEIKQFNWKLVE